MSTAVIVLASIAALLEIVGIVITVQDIQKARRRMANYLQRPRHVHLSAGLSITATLTASGVTSSQSPERRLDALEAWQGGLPDQLEQREDRLAKRLTERFDGQLKASEDTLGDQLEGLRELVAGEGSSPWFSDYKGPLILTVGVVVGLAANIVGTL
ncbi:hypothetical protein [Streptomyces sp. NPDC001507]|uniref:hypothetical protein n=1 Tax=Streptomyces sp. NPDC001507 TaxID=3364579 RepID=UPI0036C90CFC